MDQNPLKQLSKLGQSIWLDDIHRGMITSGELQNLIVEDDLRGITSNPAILKRAVSEHQDYHQQLSSLLEHESDTEALYEALVLQDIAAAADLLRPVYDATRGLDGYVSLEVSPRLADDTQATVKEARRLWGELQRPNIMIKVPATLAGLPAMAELLADGININATLIFSIQRYREVARAHQEGLQRRLADGESVASVASVASFFISRIDSLVDQRLDAMAREDSTRAQGLGAMRGRAAIATARHAYQQFQRQLASPSWQELARADAMPQRLLWASTSTKDPGFSDVKYVEALIAPYSVNTLPMETFKAYRDHGSPDVRIEQDLDSDAQLLEQLDDEGIQMSEVSAQLEREGVEKFVVAYDELLGVISDLAKTISAG